MTATRQTGLTFIFYSFYWLGPPACSNSDIRQESLYRHIARRLLVPTQDSKTQKQRGYISKPGLGIEPTIRVLERLKTVRATWAATVISNIKNDLLL